MQRYRFTYYIEYRSPKKLQKVNFQDLLEIQTFRLIGCLSVCLSEAIEKIDDSVTYLFFFQLLLPLLTMIIVIIILVTKI